MSASERTFGALIAHEGVTVVEYRRERTGLRIVGQWTDAARLTSIDEAVLRVSSLITASGVQRARLALAIEQFGVVHHVMTVPNAPDEVLRPIVMREVQRIFGVVDPVVAFTAGAAQERRGPSRADESTAPRQLFVAGSPFDTISALVQQLQSKQVRIDIATVVPKAMHSLYEATGASLEPTAVLVCLESGPHLAFFLDGRLELAIDPPIALEGDRPTPEMILDQVERGAVYFRQQFRGATATRVLLAARAEEYDAIAKALEDRMSARVKPLFPGAATPEAVIAMGAVLEAGNARPLDLFPLPPSAAKRAAVVMRGPNAVAAVGAVAAAVAMWWAGAQVVSASGMQKRNDALRDSVRAAIPAVAPMRQVAEHRADLLRQVDFVRIGLQERASLASTLTAIGATLPDGVVLDTLGVARAHTGWTARMAGKASGTSAAQAVRALQRILESLRDREGVSGASLDGFDYTTPAATDSTKHDAGVTLQFQISFALARPEAPR